MLRSLIIHTWISSFGFWKAVLAIAVWPYYLGVQFKPYFHYPGWPSLEARTKRLHSATVVRPEQAF